MALEAPTPSPPPHRRFNECGLESSTAEKRPKRASDDDHQLAGWLVALRSGGEAASSSAAVTTSTVTKSSDSTARIYKCGKCGKGFRSHQALGGHMTRHRNQPRTNAVGHRKPSHTTSTDAADFTSGAPGPHRLHTCSTCGKSLPTGQALGGHMRKHYGGSVSSSDGASGITSFSGGGAVSYSNGDGNSEVTGISRNFDLNLPPSLELDLTLKL